MHDFLYDFFRLQGKTDKTKWKINKTLRIILVTLSPKTTKKPGYQNGMKTTVTPLNYSLWSKCMFEKRLLIVEAEWLTVNSTFICKSNDEWWLELETNILILLKKISLRTEKRRQKFQFFHNPILTYTIILSVPILIRGDYKSFFTPSRLFFSSNNLLQFCFLQLQEFIFKKNISVMFSFIVNKPIVLYNYKQINTVFLLNRTKSGCLLTFVFLKKKQIMIHRYDAC